VNSQLDLYADDTTVAGFAHVSNMAKLEHLLNSSVNELRLWADANKLPLNKEKTKVLMVRRALSTLNLSLDLNLFSRSNVY